MRKPSSWHADTPLNHTLLLGLCFPFRQPAPLIPPAPSSTQENGQKKFYQIRTDASDGKPPRTTSVAFRNLSTYGFGTATNFQKSIGNVFLKVASIFRKLHQGRQQRIDTLHDLEGVVHSGEMLCVLGPPGSGCSTFLCTIAGDTHGFHVSDNALLNYQGIRPEEMATAFRGEAI